MSVQSVFHCPCNCHNPEYRKITRTRKHKNCDECVAALIREAEDLGVVIGRSEERQATVNWLRGVKTRVNVANRIEKGEHARWDNLDKPVWYPGMPDDQALGADSTMQDAARFFDEKM